MRVPSISHKQLLELGELVDYGGHQRDERRAGSGSGGQVREHGQEEGAILDGGPAEDAEDARKVVEELENQRVSADLGSQIPDSDQPLPEQDCSVQDRDLESINGIGRLGALETDPPRAQVRGPQADQGVVRDGQINTLVEGVSGLEFPPEVHMARVQEPQPVRRGLRGDQRVTGGANSPPQEGNPGLDKAARDEGGFPEARKGHLGVEATAQDVLRRGDLRESQRPGDVVAEAGPRELVEVGHDEHVLAQLEALRSRRQGADEGSQGLRGREDDVDGVAAEEGEGVSSEEGVDGLELGERQISEGEPVSAGDEREDGLRDALVAGDGPYPGEDVNQEKDKAVDIVELSDVEVELHRPISCVHGHESPGFVGGGDPKEGLVPLNGDDVFGVDGLEELKHLGVPKSRQGGQLRGELREHVERSSGEGPGLVEGEPGAGDAGGAGVGAVEGLDDEREEPGEVLGDEQGEFVDFRETRPEPLAAKPVNSDSRRRALAGPTRGPGTSCRRPGRQTWPGWSPGAAACLSGAGEVQVEIGDSEERASELEVGEEEWEVEPKVLNDEVRQVLKAGSNGRGLEEPSDGVLRVQVAPEVDDVGQVVSVQVEVAGQKERVRDEYGRVPARARCKVLRDHSKKVLSEVAPFWSNHWSKLSIGYRNLGYHVIYREQRGQHPHGLGLRVQEGLDHNVQVFPLEAHAVDPGRPSVDRREDDIRGREHARGLEDLGQHLQSREKLPQDQVAGVKGDLLPDHEPPVPEEDGSVHAAYLLAVQEAVRQLVVLGPLLTPHVQIRESPRGPVPARGAQTPPLWLERELAVEVRERLQTRLARGYTPVQRFLREELGRNLSLHAREQPETGMSRSVRCEYALQRAPELNSGVGCLLPGREGQVRTHGGLHEGQRGRVAHLQLVDHEVSLREEPVHSSETHVQVGEEDFVGVCRGEMRTGPKDQLPYVLVEEVQQQHDLAEVHAVSRPG
ncbi:hypothetical protein OJ253_2525 [Cryptosporidium canis]|uniref:Uncharacterized protein n=1 Tax=Cryptosporidium canis TaxID=195482 RepID=A0A9D5DFB6_9CRYT|nr:hypothetical protein OJ253_2525 [Cryptosporidium canis]